MDIYGIQKYGDTFVVRVVYPSRNGAFDIADHIFLKSDGSWSVQFDYETKSISSNLIDDYMKVMVKAKLMIDQGKYLEVPCIK